MTVLFSKGKIIDIGNNMYMLSSEYDSRNLPIIVNESVKNYEENLYKIIINFGNLPETGKYVFTVQDAFSLGHPILLLIN